MFYQSPLNCLVSEKQKVERDIEWYAKPNRKGTNYSDAYRAEQIAKLQALLEEYEIAIEKLKAVL